MKQMMLRLQLWTLGIALLTAIASCSEPDQIKVVNVVSNFLHSRTLPSALNQKNQVLFGATGNLAKKYLWQGLYNIWDENLYGTANIVVYPVATKDPSISIPLLDQALKQNITARSTDKHDEFLNHVRSFVQLREPIQYDHLAEVIQSDLQRARQSEVGRLFYLSVPPKYFGSISHEIDRALRPTNPEAWLRVVIEKPFGTNLASAEQLSKSIGESLKPDELLLVDHYMGKECVRVIPWFRSRNPLIDEVMNSAEVDSIIIEMLEEETVEGRTGFYDEVGVVRDVFQNHLTLLLSLLTMGKQPGKLESSRHLIDARIEAVRSMRIDYIETLQQYIGYKKHLQQDRNRYQESPDSSQRFSSTTPTFASIVLKVQNSRWNTDVRLVAGKALGERRATVSVLFRSDDQLIFNIQGKYHELDGCSVLSTKFLPELKLPARWRKVHSHRYDAPQHAPSAYQTLLLDALLGKRESFVTIEEVILSWKVWDAVLDADIDLETYEIGGRGIHPDTFSSYPEDIFLVGYPSHNEL